MRFEPRRAAIRFGCGLSPSIAPPPNVASMLEALEGPDEASKRFPIPDFEFVRTAAVEIAKDARQMRKGDTKELREQARKKLQTGRRALRREAASWFRQTLLRRALTEDGFRERLTFFWADHFTAQGKGPIMRTGYMPYIEDAIRPHVAGRFSDMLRAVIVHPLMLIYLDQTVSVGPNSVAARRNEKLSGLNENLAREVMELHTLGVDGPYTQADVRGLAELLTGLSFWRKAGFRFRPNFAEPGEKTVLGRRYGGAEPRIEYILQAMEDLAVHPATAAHVARKLAVHFVGDTPDPAMVEAMTRAYTANGGSLVPVYAAMLQHPGAWNARLGNVKQPIDFIASTLRALDVVPRHVPTAPRQVMRHLIEPMVLMGQPWGAPAGPDGWPEEDKAWITPQRMAARLQWGMTVPFLLKRLLPDPREFAEIALGPDAPEPVRFAARAAETRAEGVGVVLASPAFHRT